jgi:hypothetical protein
VVELVRRFWNVDAAKRININLEDPIMPAELKTYYPSPRERMDWLLRDLFVGDRRATALEDHLIRGTMGLVDIPGTPLFGAYDGTQMMTAGIVNRSPLQVAGGATLAALSALPLAGKALQGPIRRALKCMGVYDPPTMSPRPFEADYPGSIPADAHQGTMQRASQTRWMNNPPARPPRPFEDDYPGAIPADARGRLTHDIDGQPINSKWVVGRKVAGGPDEPFPVREYDALAKAIMGIRTKTLPPSQMGQDLGYTRVSDTGQPLYIRLRDDVAPGQMERVYAHELGHVIDQLTGDEKFTKDLLEELPGIYNTLNNPMRSLDDVAEAHPLGGLFTPLHHGYPVEEARRELWAEAIRANLVNPNYIKTVAPKTAAAIRAAARENPRLAGIIQFNSALAPVVGAGLLPSLEDASDSRKKANGGGRLDLRDLPPSDGLPIEEWIKRRNQQTNKLRR